MDDAFDIAVALAAAAYLVGIPVSAGVGIAMGVGPAAILLSPFWPVVGLAWLGYWVAT
ncbi:hypothetical protein [Pusillimonas noertemannii]|uniref:hypothetical protein n=1 Tax=Pusillimonas noertemannii TaxID=305977 RepID=UPI00333E2F1C